MTNKFESAVVKNLIDQMFNKSHCFSICDLDKLGQMLGVNPQQHRNYKFLNALHCVHYNDMDPTIKSELQNKVVETLRPDLTINVDSMAFLLLAEGNNFTPIEDEQFANVRRLK